jgi:hypothetical protein
MSSQLCKILGDALKKRDKQKKFCMQIFKAGGKKGKREYGVFAQGLGRPAGRLFR